MNTLNPRELELVALGAAMGSNCTPCIDYHIRESKKIGLTEQEIFAAIQFADKVRQVPANKVLQTALKLLPSAVDGCQGDPAAETRECASESEAAKLDSGQVGQFHDMMSMMSKIMELGGCPTQSGSKANGAAPNPAVSKGCGCG